MYSRCSHLGPFASKLRPHVCLLHSLLCVISFCPCRCVCTYAYVLVFLYLFFFFATSTATSISLLSPSIQYLFLSFAVLSSRFIYFLREMNRLCYAIFFYALFACRLIYLSCNRIFALVFKKATACLKVWKNRTRMCAPRKKSTFRGYDEK